MKANLDESVYFDEQNFELDIKSWQRDAVERGAPGLDGIVSIDMGLGKRVITQTGVIREPSRAKLEIAIMAINILFDGSGHTLTCPDGRIFENVKIDSVETGDVKFSGASAVCKYKITYTQLG